MHQDAFQGLLDFLVYYTTTKYALVTHQNALISVRFIKKRAITIQVYLNKLFFLIS